MIQTPGHVKMRTARAPLAALIVGKRLQPSQHIHSAFPKQVCVLLPFCMLGKNSGVEWAKSQAVLAVADYHAMKRNPYGLLYILVGM